MDKQNQIESSEIELTVCTISSNLQVSLQNKSQRKDVPIHDGRNVAGTLEEKEIFTFPLKEVNPRCFKKLFSSLFVSWEAQHT